MKTIHTLFPQILISLFILSGIAHAQERNTTPPHQRVEMMTSPMADMEDLGLQTVMFNEDSCYVDTVFVLERYSDHLDLRIHPAPDSAQYRYRLIDTIDPTASVPDSLWSTGGVTDTCCFTIDSLTETTTYALQTRVWCPDDQQFLQWSDLLYDTTRCPAPVDGVPTSSFDGDIAKMVYDVSTTGWEWVLQREGSPVAQHVVTDENFITWRIDPEVKYLWKVRVRCGDGWSDYTSDQELEKDPETAASCQAPPDEHFSAYNVGQNQVSLKCTMDGSQYKWGMKAHGSTSWLHKTTSSSNYIWDALKPGTQYEYKVQVHCGDGYWSDFSKGKYFTTDDPCYTPDYHHMESKDVSYETATTYCHMKGKKYHWYIRPHHSNYGWKDDYSDVGHYKWAKLRHNTKYEYKVKVKCDDGYWSDFSPTMYFTTHNKYNQHCYTPTAHHLYAKNISYQTATTYCDMKGYSYHWFLRPHGSKDWTRHHEGSHSYHRWEGLHYGTKYEYKVKVKCHSGYWTDFSPIKYFTTHKHDPCYTPEGHHLSTKDITYNSASTHCEVKGASYHWYMRAYGTHEWKHHQVSHGHYDWKNLKYGTKYEYKVKVKCHNGVWTGWSPTKYFTTKDHYSDYCTTPLSHHMSADKISYNSATTHCKIKGVSYHWYMRPYGSQDWQHHEVSHGYYNWKNLKYGTKYEYKVKVKCSSGYWTSWSPTKYFSTHDHYDSYCTTPSSHHLSAKNITYNSASTYCDIQGVSYHWYMRPYGSQDWQHDEVSHGYYNWKNLKYGTKYEYKVKVKCSSGYWTSWSPTKYFSTHDHYDSYCTTPTSYHLSAKDISYNSATTHCDMQGSSYHWYIRPYGSHTWMDYQGSSAHHTWSDLKYGTKYEYMVKVKCSNGWTGWSPSMYFTTHDHYNNYCSVPGPYDFTAIHIEWNEFHIYMYAPNTEWMASVKPPEGDWWTHTTTAQRIGWGNLEPNTQYQYRVKRKCHDGTWSDWSYIKTFWTGVSPTGRPADGSVNIIDGVNGALIQTRARVLEEARIYPSPASDFFSVDGDILPGSTVRVLNLQGQDVLQHVNATVADRINVQGLQSGVYQVILTLTDGTLQTSKLMVTH